MKIWWLVIMLFVVSCDSNIEDHNVMDVDSSNLFFTYDYLVPIMDVIHCDMGEIPSEMDDLKYRQWFVNYKLRLIESIKKDNQGQSNFKVITFAKLPDNMCYVDYDGSCELIHSDELPIRVIHTFNKNFVCPKPEENRFLPVKYTKSFSKSLVNCNGYKAIVQVWSSTETKSLSKK